MTMSTLRLVRRTGFVRSFRYMGSASLCPKIKPHDVTTGKDEVSKVNDQYRGRLEIQDMKHGYGLFAMRDFTKGDYVMTGRALETGSERTSHSVQVDWDSHAEMDLPASLINHSCNANVGIKDNSEGAYDFFSLKEIAKGEELLWDYEASEFEIQNFPCSCGSTNCRGDLKGFEHHGDKVRNQYGDEYIADYLKTPKV